MNFLDALLFPDSLVIKDGDDELPPRSAISFLGGGVTVTDNPSKDQIDVLIEAGGQSGEGVVYADNVGALRAVSLASVKNGSLAMKRDTIRMYVFVDSLTAPDDNDKIIRPVSIDADKPGRWVASDANTSVDASDVSYDPSASGLVADDVQAAIDELASRPSGGESNVLASVDIDLVTIPSPHDVLVYTVPACIKTKIYEIDVTLVDFGGTGTVTLRAGNNPGGNGIILDQPITSASVVGKSIAGLDISTLGASWSSSTGYILERNQGEEIYIRLTTTGSITKGRLLVRLKGEVVNASP